MTSTIGARGNCVEDIVSGDIFSRMDPVQMSQLYRELDTTWKGEVGMTSDNQAQHVMTAVG